MSQALAKYESEGREVLGMFQAFAVDSPERYKLGAEALVTIKTIRKNIKTERDAVVKPQQEALEATRELFKRIDSRYEEAEAELKKRLAAYADEQKAREAKLLAEAATAETHALALVEEAAPVAPGVQTRSKKRWAIVDLDKIPAEFFVLDDVAIGKAVRAGETIPGIRVWEETIIAAGTKT